MKPSPLLLDDLFLGEISITPSDGAIPMPPYQMQVKAEPWFGRNESDHSKWLVRLKVEFGCEDASKPVAYEGHVEFHGHFSVADKEMSEDKMRNLIAVNCPSIMYSSIREVVALLTGRAKHGKLLLPSVSFIDLKVEPTKHVENVAEPAESALSQ